MNLVPQQPTLWEDACLRSVPLVEKASRRMINSAGYAGRSVSAERRAFIASAESAADVNPLRHATHTGRPLGSPDFVAGLEELISRPLAPAMGDVRRTPQPIAGKPRSPRLLQLERKTGCVPSSHGVPFPRSHSEACDRFARVRR